MSAGGGAAPARRVRLFGLSVETAFPFRTLLAPGRPGPVDLEISVAADRPAAGGAAATTVYESPERLEDGQPALVVERAAGWDRLRFSRVADVLCAGSAIRVERHPAASDDLVEIQLLGTVLAFWFERAGELVLHGSAVELDGRAVAFIAGNGRGKSSLAAQLMTLGRPLVTDDLVVVDAAGPAPRIRPGYPQMRFWPDAAIRFVHDPEALDHVHPDFDKRRLPVGPDGFGTFCDRTLPLAAVYLPRRLRGAGAAEAMAMPVAPAGAVLELVARSFMPRLVEAAGWQGDRLGRLARVVETVPVRWLDYPSGYDRLERVARAVLADLATLPRTGPRARGRSPRAPGTPSRRRSES